MLYYVIGTNGNTSNKHVTIRACWYDNKNVTIIVDKINYYDFEICVW